MTTVTTAETLPTIEERPDAAIVIYDGHCRFCTGGAQTLHRWDRGGKLAFVSLHDPQVTQRWPNLTHDLLMEQMFVIDPQGGQHGGAAAFRYLSRRLPRLWLLAPFMHLPFTMPLWQWAYKQVAKRRYKLAGKTDACEDDACKIHFK
ncbi:MAG TPA: DUF393 domain-containing protein [Pirellulaceae bacterium]|nr:DUF393 domain-containing protein [Pirellulaceae bacterium]